MIDLFGDFYVVIAGACPFCDEIAGKLNHFTDDNRTHLTCLSCGETYASIHGDEDDSDIKEIGGFTYVNLIPIKGNFLECRQ